MSQEPAQTARTCNRHGLVNDRHSQISAATLRWGWGRRVKRKAKSAAEPKAKLDAKLHTPEAKIAALPVKQDGNKSHLERQDANTFSALFRSPPSEIRRGFRSVHEALPAEPAPCDGADPVVVDLSLLPRLCDLRGGTPGTYYPPVKKVL